MSIQTKYSNIVCIGQKDPRKKLLCLKSYFVYIKNEGKKRSQIMFEYLIGLKTHLHDKKTF